MHDSHVPTKVPVDLSSILCKSSYFIIIIIIISAVHATVGKWPPQLTPCTSILSHPHPLTATSFLHVVSPSPVGSPSNSLSFSGCPFWCYLGPPGVAHSSYMSSQMSSHAPHSLSLLIFHPSFTSYYFIPNLVSLHFKAWPILHLKTHGFLCGILWHELHIPTIYYRSSGVTSLTVTAEEI